MVTDPEFSDFCILIERIQPWCPPPVIAPIPVIPTGGAAASPPALIQQKPAAILAVLVGLLSSVPVCVFVSCLDVTGRTRDNDVPFSVT